jgi:DNA-binding transcriptional LysR family regulator
MDTKFLESFVMVVEDGSVAAAARRLNLTAAAVTQRVRALEREMGVTLITRCGRTALATEAGAAILGRARELLQNARDLRAIATEESYSGELGLGAISSSLTGILPPLLARLTEKYPLMKLYICPGISGDLYRKVEEGKLDAAVIVEPQFALPKTCGWATWREEPLVVLAPSTLPETDPHKILKSEPFIRYDRKQVGGRLADMYLQRADIRPKDRYELDALDAIAVLVDRGLGVSLVPDWAGPWPEGLALRKIPLPRACEKRRIGLVWRLASPRIRLVTALAAEAPAIRAPGNSSRASKRLKLLRCRGRA